MKYIIVLSLLLLFSCNQKQSVYADSDVIIESFFNAYKDQSPRTALNALFGTNTYFETMHSQSIGEIKDRLISYADSVGEYCGYEIVSRRIIGHSLIHYSCVVKYEIQPFRFMLTFYKPKEKWLLFNFQFSANFTGELDESSKFYYIE
jgi:hypothetical protein